MNTYRRISAEKLHNRAAELTPRDRELLSHLVRVRLASGSQLLRLVWPDASASDARVARRQLERLTRWRFLARLERRVGGLGRGSTSWTYALDVAGLRLTGRTDAHRPRLPRPAMWEHALKGTEVYVLVCEALRGTDRRLSAWYGEPACWRRFTGPLGTPVLLKPDAFISVEDEQYRDLAFVEIDTGSQTRSVIRSKLTAYRTYYGTGTEQRDQGGTFPLVAFLTTSVQRHGVLVDLVGELPTEAWSMFAIGLITDAPRVLGGVAVPP